MSSQISSQANKLWQVITAPNTAEIYRQALAVTGKILKEASVLVWLVFCLVLVAFDWFWGRSIGLGQKARAWVNRFDSNNKNEMASQIGQSLAINSQSSLEYLVRQAREQLGLPTKPPTLITNEGLFMTTQQPEDQKQSDKEQTPAANADVKTETVAVKEVSPEVKNQPGEDEEVSTSPIKEA